MAGTTVGSDQRRRILASFNCEAVVAALAEIVKFGVGKLCSKPVRGRILAPIGDELLLKFSAGRTVGHAALLMCCGNSTQSLLSETSIYLS
jgi:hypothetical protein